MKKILMIAIALGLSACTNSFKAQTTLNPNPVTGGITFHNYDMNLSSSSATFTHIATVNPHVLNGELLQATGFEKQGSYAFIVYNTAGDTIRGGLDIVSLATLNSPVLVSSMVSENSEYAEVKVKGNYLYMVGQKKNSTKNDAVLTIVDISNKSTPVVASEMGFTTGYYATSIDIQGNKAYITVPNEGVKVVDITNPLAPALLSTEGSSQGNSLFTRRLGSKSLVLGGSSNQNVTAVNGTTTLLKQISSQPQAAPSRFTVKSNFFYTNGGNTGLTILDKINTNSPVQKSQTVVGGTGNGIAVDSCDQLYLAQGEMGLVVVDATSKTAPLQKGIFDYHGSQEDSGSANNVALMKTGGNLYVLVADGLGGVKIVKVTQASCSGNGDESDEDDEDHGDGLACKVYDFNPNHPSSLPDFSTLTPVGSFTAAKLDVIGQTYANSFPLFPTPLKYLKEWYGIVCKGTWESKAAEAVTFTLGSDDGAKLYLDDAVAVNHDGLNSPSSVSATVNVVKKDYDVKVEYFQGPASQIQLELKLQSPSIPLKYMDSFSH